MIVCLYHITCSSTHRQLLLDSMPKSDINIFLTERYLAASLIACASLMLRCPRTVVFLTSNARIFLFDPQPFQRRVRFRQEKRRLSDVSSPKMEDEAEAVHPLHLQKLVGGSMIFVLMVGMGRTIVGFRMFTYLLYVFPVPMLNIGQDTYLAFSLRGFWSHQCSNCVHIRCCEPPVYDVSLWIVSFWPSFS